MKTVTLGAEVTQGFDISYCQPVVDYEALERDGMKFGIIRSSYGVVPDTYFDRHWKGIEATALMRSAYCYFRPSEDPIKQAERLKGMVGSFSGDLPPTIDCEQTDGVPAAEDKDRILAFLKELGCGTIYGGAWYLQALGFTPEEVAPHALWLAAYPRVPSRETPLLIPDAWSVPSFWQYSNSNNKLDVNWFNGPSTQLEKLIL